MWSADRSGAVERFFSLALLGMLVSGFLALLASGELDWPTAALCTAAFAARIVLHAKRLRIDVPVELAAVLVIAYAGFYPLDLFYISHTFIAATVRLILFLTILKGLTVRTARDAGYAAALAFAELLAAALISASLAFFAFLAMFLFSGVAAFCSWQVRRGLRRGADVQAPGFSGRLLAASAFTWFGILAFTVCMFFVLPRTARAALQNLVSSRYRMAGFSGQVTLGDIGEIQSSNRPVFHVKLDHAPDVLPYRWRGAGLNTFDGHRWSFNGSITDSFRLSGGMLRLPERSHLGRSGRRIEYQVQLGDTSPELLFIAGIPEFLRVNVPGLLRLSSGALRTLGDTPSVLRYDVTAFLDDAGGDGSREPFGEERERLLALPPLDPRMAETARSLTAGLPTPDAKARRIEGWLRQSFSYTLELPDKEQADPIGYFLFTRRKGHCEYFASSMALMLRSLGIPTRVVTGFHGGVKNPINDWYVIRASDAHSWVEAWLPGSGWTIFDPTPAAQPSAQFAVMRHFSQMLDAADLFWQEWVMDYDLDRQFHLALRLEESRLGLRGNRALNFVQKLDGWRHRAADAAREHALAIFLLLLAALTAAFIAPWLLRRSRRLRHAERLRQGIAEAGDATRLYRRLLESLSERGLEKPDWITPLEFTRVLPPSETAEQVAHFTALYNRLRFGDEPAVAPEMIRVLETIERIK